MLATKPKMILIDVDGTLVDSVPDLAWCVDEMMLTLNLQPHGQDKVREWVGNGVERLVRRALVGQLEGEPEDSLFESAYPVFLDLYRDNTSKPYHRSFNNAHWCHVEYNISNGTNNNLLVSNINFICN